MLLGRPLFDKAHALNPVFVARKPPANIAQKAAIDFIDDLELPGQHLFKPRHRPLFERFGQQSVIRVCQRVLCDMPGFIPFEVHLIQQNSHEFRHCQRGVGIVHLNRHFLCKQAPIRVGALEAAHRICQRAGNKEVLLQQA